METDRLHIVAFDIPYPPDYGGVIDVFYKIRALQAMGAEITLHTFLYRREKSPELEKLCREVYYYPRKTGLRYTLQPLPYIVASRKIPALLQNLLKDDAPVLLEGLHCCGFLPELRQAGKTVIVRTHNIEHEYYTWLAETENRTHRKLFFRAEAHKLRQYEKYLRAASGIAAISPGDTHHFLRLNPKTVCIPAFHGLDDISPRSGKGNYALYHGNLEVSDNLAAVEFLLREVFYDDIFPLVIAGKNPPASLKKIIAERPWIRLAENPDTETMNALISEAQMHVLPARGNAGMKLKLLHALYRGRFVIANHAMTGNDLPPDLCEMADNATEWRNQVIQWKEKEFSEQDVQKRTGLLNRYFSDQASVMRLYPMLRGNLPPSR